MNRVVLDRRSSLGTISRNIYGHFAEHLGRCIYQGIYVGEDSPIPNEKGIRKDVVEALRRMKLPLVRWPGGCFADTYHWRDGIGPREHRRRLVDPGSGQVTDDHSFGTHEFMEFCRQVGCEPYFGANLGSGTVQEMADWVEYLNASGDSTLARERAANGHPEPFGVRYWGIGNESWGCGGHMRAEYFVDEYRRYQTFCRDYMPYKLYRIACGPCDGNTDWTDAVMKGAGRFMDGLSLHYYAVPGPSWDKKGSATRFTREEYYVTLEKAARIDDYIKAHLAVMDRYDPEHRVGLVVDEWGCWYDPDEDTNPGFLYQQNTMRDAMVAALSLNIFSSHCDRIVMANIAQMVNVLQAVILTEGDRMVLTPTYHVFEMYKGHQDARHIAAAVMTDQVTGKLGRITASASEKDGVVTVTLANLDSENETDVALDMDGLRAEAIQGCILHGSMSDYNDFDHPETVTPRAYDGFAQQGEGRVTLRMPPCSVVALEIRGG